ncbi:MAG: hypothetical protein KGJ86_16760 [Chloroflexota bacterium]|nr:hypothetical protein [Chloroflexota bacterium]
MSEQAITRDPACEEGFRQVMLWSYALGRQNEALLVRSLPAGAYSRAGSRTSTVDCRVAPAHPEWRSRLAIASRT